KSTAGISIWPAAGRLTIWSAARPVWSAARPVRPAAWPDATAARPAAAVRFRQSSGPAAVNYSTIQFHPGPRIASIVLNRPPLNIINLEMLDELNAAWSEVEDLKAQVAVLSGAGEHAFSAGVEVADHMPGKIDTMIEKFHHFVRRIRKSDCIKIAAIS